MSPQKFFYVSYIKTTPDELWRALTSPEFTRQYWMDNRVDSDWKIGSTVKFTSADGKLTISGKVLASERPKLLSYTWSLQLSEETKLEKPSRVVFQIERYEPNPQLVKLTVTHDDFPVNSKVFPGISTGWPLVLSGLKTLLETKEGTFVEGTCG
jgi:uncharacterized protein YndB with AHSA1/START domain